MVSCNKYGVIMNNNGYMYLDGFYEVRQDDEIVLPYTHNKFLDNGMRGFISIIACGSVRLSCAGGSYSSGLMLPASDWNIYLGNDTTTPTLPTMTILTSPIGTSPGTAPDNKTITVKDGSFNGVWNVVFTAVWNPGSITGIIGELGLYARWPTNLNYKWGVDTCNSFVTPATTMGSRLCVADNEFTAITIDSSKSVAVNWKLQFAFE